MTATGGLSHQGVEAQMYKGRQGSLLHLSVRLLRRSASFSWVRIESAAYDHYIDPHYQTSARYAR